MPITAQEKADHANAVAGVPEPVTELIAEIWYRFEEYCGATDERIRARHAIELNKNVSDLISHHPDFDVITGQYSDNEDTDKLPGVYEAMENVHETFHEFEEATTLIRRATELDRLSNAVGDLISWHKEYNYHAGRIDGVYEDE
jgi:hypothetical protein